MFTALAFGVFMFYQYYMSKNICVCVYVCKLCIIILTN